MVVVLVATLTGSSFSAAEGTGALLFDKCVECHIFQFAFYQHHQIGFENLSREGDTHRSSGVEFD